MTVIPLCSKTQSHWSSHCKQILSYRGVFHLQKISGNFGGNFHRVKNVFHLTQVRSPPSDCDFTRQNLKMWPWIAWKWRLFKSCKWNTHSHRKVSNGKTGLPFQKFHLFRKFSSRRNQKRVFHLHPTRNFRNFLVNENAHEVHTVFGMPERRNT